MKHTFFTLILALALVATVRGAYTEFYCDTATGANINAGDNAATTTTTTNGAYARGAGAGGTDRFTAASGTPFATAAVGDFVSVYADGATVTTFTGRITATNATTTVDISLTAIAGTRPSDAASGVSATIGGKWKGPNAASGFPFAHVASTLTNASGHTPRVNFKGGTNYDITAAITQSTNGPIRWEGYTTTAGDGGRATIDGGTSGASYALLTVSGSNNDLVNFILQNNGATGSASGLVISGTESPVQGCVVNSVRGIGIDISSTFTLAAECEAYACNQSNTVSLGGFRANATGSTLIRCVSHDNAGSNTSGFQVQAVAHLIGCIADTNGAKGFIFTASTGGLMVNCEAYNNTSDGVDYSSSSLTPVCLESCNFVKNGGWGINTSGSATLRNGFVRNCGFGAGTQANTSGTVATIQGVNVAGSVNYANDVTPWTDPANGDFRISLSTAKGAGRGTFTQTAASYSGAIGYPDIGAGQHLDSPRQTSSASVK